MLRWPQLDTLVHLPSKLGRGILRDIPMDYLGAIDILPCLYCVIAALPPLND